MDLTEEIVIVKPRPGSKKFQTMEGVKNVHSVSRDGGATYGEESVGIYTKERFPKSRQMFRPDWSSSKRRWVMKGFEDNSPELNELVKRCRLKYKPGHPKQNQFIEECDIYDFADPFLTHKQFRVLAQEGDTLLYKNHPLDKLVLAGLLVNPKFQYVGNGNADNAMYSNRVKYIIIDKNVDKVNKKVSREKDMEILDTWKALNDKKKLAIAMSLSLITSEDTDREIIDDVLYSFATSKETPKGSQMSKQDMFLSVAKLSTADLNLQYTIGKAKASGFLKKTRQGWMLYGNNIGREDSDVIAYLSNSSNQEVMFRLEESLANQ